jgi:hypothetical protein
MGHRFLGTSRSPVLGKVYKSLSYKIVNFDHGHGQNPKILNRKALQLGEGPVVKQMAPNEHAGRGPGFPR